ncbi:TPA: hypothetical protein ACH3X3_006220 [Trebouxia sp. C0006]
MTAEDVPNTPAAAGWGSDLASHRPLTPQQGTTPGITPISKAIALLQHRSNTTPNASQGRTQRTAELSARKAELATLLNLVKTMESDLYIPKGGSTTPRSDPPAVIKPKTSPAQTAAAAARVASEAAGDSPAAALPNSLNPLGSAIHQNLADRLKAAKVPGHAGNHNTPPGAGAGAADSVALKRKRSMQDSVQHLRRLASEKSTQLGHLTTSNLSAVHTGGGQAGVPQILASRLRHAATMDSSSPDSLSSHSPLDTPAGDVRQRLLFDCHESRFGESAEPDLLSFGSPQSAERAQHAQQAEQHDLGAMSSSFQAFSLQSSLSSPRLLHQSSAPSSGLATPQPLERNHSTGLQLQRSGGDSDQGEDRDGSGASPMRQALDRLAQRAWSNRKGTPDPNPALNRTISSLTPDLGPTQALQDPPSPAAIPATTRHAALASGISNRNNSLSHSRHAESSANAAGYTNRDGLSGESAHGHSNRNGRVSAGHAVGSRNSATSRDTRLPLRSVVSDASELLGKTRLPLASASQASTALVVRSEDTALIPSSSNAGSVRWQIQDVPRAEHQLKQKVLEVQAALEAKKAVCDRLERQLQLSANQLQRQHNVEARYNEAQHRLRSAETTIQGLQANVQARDDSIASFQMLQQQGPSPGQKERLAQLARQLEDAQAQLLASQAEAQDKGSESSRLQAALQNQQVHNDQLQNALQATEAELQEATALTDAEHLQVRLLQEAAGSREAAVQLLTQQLQDTEERLQRQGQQLQGQQQEADELRRLHLRLERANEHVNQLQSRLASQQGCSSPSKCADQLAEAKRAQHAQQLEISSLRQQLDAWQADASSSNSDAEVAEAQRAQQAAQLDIKALRQQLETCQAGNSGGKDDELEALKAEVASLRTALAQTSELSRCATQASRDNQQVVGSSTEQEQQHQSTTSVDSLSSQSCSLDSAPADWQRLAVQEEQVFCHQLGRLQQEHKQLQATVSDQCALISQHSDKLEQQSNILTQAASDLTEKAAALQHCSDQAALLQSKLTDSKSVTSLQADQLAVLQAEVDQLCSSLATAERSLATAESSAAGSSGEQVQKLQQEVTDLKSELQQHSDKAAQAEARMQEQHSAAREAFHQASAHARSAQQAEARCQALEQVVQTAHRKAESTAHVQQEVLDLQLAVQMRDDHLAECQRQSELDQQQIDDLERQLLMQAADEEELVHLENLLTQSQAAEAEAIRQAAEATQRLSAASAQHVTQLESELQQTKLQLQRLQEQMKVLTEERDTMANALEAKESQLLGLQAQVDLLRNHNSETEAWLTSM